MSQRRNTVFGALRRRHTAAFAFVAAAGLAACSAEQVTAPAQAAPSGAPSAALLGAGTQSMMSPFSSLNLTPTDFAAYASLWRTGATDQFAGTRQPKTFSCGMSTGQGRATIGTGGGTITVGRATFTVPAGALSASTTITATFTKSASGVEVDMWPHGLKFAKPATMQFDLSGCSLPWGSTLNVYYVDDADYVRQVMPSTTGSGSIRALTDHFSGFVVGWGIR